MNQSVQSYLGKVVTLQGGGSAETYGLVTAVTHKDGVMKLTVNGSDHDASHVTRVELPQEQE